MIHTLTLNPALDRIIYLPRFQRNVTNRIKTAVTVLGGKGTHVSVDLKQLGKDNTAWGISFGETGKQIIRLLEQENIITRFFHYPIKDSRTNYLIVEESADCTILSQKGVSLTEQMLAALTEAMKVQMKPGDILVLSGDVSNCNPDIYNLLLHDLKDKQLSVFLDTSGPGLKECIKASPFLIKPNLNELACLCGMPESSLTTPEAIMEAIRMLSSYRIHVIAVSLGGDGSLVKYQDDFYRVLPPKSTRAINTIGCGDCFLSGLIAGFSEGLEITETLRLAAAASAATAESTISVGFDPNRAKELLPEVVIHKY